MEVKKYYLREDVYFEPLFNHWYAWPYLIPPATSAMHMVNTHRRIMKSFVNNHTLHIMALKETVLTGGEFLNCSEDQVSQIQELIKEIDTDHAEIVQLSQAIRDLEELLRGHTTGESIEYLYPMIPSSLRGYVELFMDMEHRPSYRLIEPLMYRSPFYKPSLQSVSFGLLSKVKERPFVLSTPRLPDDNHFQCKIEFSSQLLDTLFSARERPISAAEVERLFADRETFGGVRPQELFTEQPSRFPHVPVTHGVRVQYTGHAGFLIETKNTAILVDPVIASRGAEFEGDVCSFSELPPKIDYVLLTHNHQDHVSIETLLQIRYKTGNVIVPKNNGGTLADPSLRLMLKNMGFKVHEVDDLDEIPLEDGRIVSIPFLGEHGDLNVRSKSAWLVEAVGRKLFFGADSSNPDERLYQHLKDLLNGVDIFAIGMECIGAPYTWLYGALHTKIVPKHIKESRRLNGSDCKQAFAMAKMLRPASVCIYALGAEPWYKYFMGIDYNEDSEQIKQSGMMIAACKEIGIPAEIMYGRNSVFLRSLEQEATN